MGHNKTPETEFTLSTTIVRHSFQWHPSLCRLPRCPIFCMKNQTNKKCLSFINAVIEQSVDKADAVTTPFDDLYWTAAALQQAYKTNRFWGNNAYADVITSKFLAMFCSHFSVQKNHHILQKNINSFKLDGLRWQTVSQYASTRKVHLLLLRHWPLIFWPQNVISSFMSPTAPKL